MQKNNWRTSALFIAACWVLGFGGSLVGGIAKKQDWYENNAKPAIWPPQWFFPLVWVANYTFMGMATSKIWQARSAKQGDTALRLFGVHFLHNMVFIPAVYSVKKRWFYVLMDAVGLLSGLATARTYNKISKSAFIWFIPYLCWLAYTTFIKVLWWRMEKRG